MITRQGRKILAVAPYGRLVHEIRLSLEDGVWRARVVTLPRQIWVEPGGKRALAFEAATPERAEALAAAFIQADCVARGHRIAEGGTPREEVAAWAPARRVIATYPLRFVPQGPPAAQAVRNSVPGLTANLSETGLFVTASSLVVPSSHLSIDSRLPGLTERLDGEVVWTREHAGPGLSSGMGVRLIEPSLSYRARIQSLR